MGTDKGGLSRRNFLRGAGLGVGLAAIGGPAWAADINRLAPTQLVKAAGAGDVLRMARVWLTSVEDAILASSFDDTHHVFDDGSIEVLLWPGDLARLQATNLRFDILVEDVIARDQRALRAADAQTSFVGQPGERDEYRTLDQFEDDLLGLVSRYPDRARLITMPERSLEGRRVLGIEIAEHVGTSDGRPVWYMDGLHHAREWPSGELTLMFAFELLENPQNDERIAGLVRDTRTILVPVVNPDGFTWSRGAAIQTSDSLASLPLAVAGQESYWRKNRRGLGTDVVLPVVQRNATGHGVDINRNYSARWGGGGASAVPVEQTYRGAGPFSEPEIRNVAQLLRERQPIAINSNHTYTGLVLRPWGHTGGDARFSPDEGLMRDLGASMCMSNGYRNIHSFDLYVTTGTTLDWAYAALGAFGYTFEIGFSNFHPPYKGTDGAVHHYGINREPFILLGETARFQQVSHREVMETRPNQFNPGEMITYATHSVIQGRAVDTGGNGVAAQVIAERTTQIPLGAGADAEFYEEPSRAVIATDPDGTFNWHLPPSTTPTAKERGAVEEWTITVEVDGRSASDSLVIDRGETKSLGDLTLS